MKWNKINKNKGRNPILWNVAIKEKADQLQQILAPIKSGFLKNAASFLLIRKHDKFPLIRN